MKNKNIMNNLVEEALKENKEFFNNQFLIIHEEDTDIVVSDKFNNIEFRNIAWLMKQDIKNIYYIDTENINLIINDRMDLDISIL